MSIKYKKTLFSASVIIFSHAIANIFVSQPLKSNPFLINNNKEVFHKSEINNKKQNIVFSKKENSLEKNFRLKNIKEDESDFFKNRIIQKDFDIVANKLGEDISKNIDDLKIKRKGFVDIEGPNISLTLKNLSAKEALFTIAKLGNYSFVFIPSNNVDSSQKTSKSKNEKLITMSFKEEKYEVVINSILMAAGLEGKKEGNILFVGEKVLNKGFNPEISKVYKMKNASASSAANYLASLGAVINKVSIIKAGGIENSSVEESFKNDLENKSYSSNQGPLLGIIGASDSRLETITIIGSPELLIIAEKYLNQIDLPQKQVALTVKILDVNLDDKDEFGNSFAFSIEKLGNPTAFIINSGGLLDISYGDTDSWTGGRGIDKTKKLEFYNNFIGIVESKQTKVLASPTMILSENKDRIDSGGESVGGGLQSTKIGRPYGNESFLSVGTNVITDFEVTPGEDGAPPTCKATFSNAGLTFGAKLHNIDLENFISFSLSPELSSISSISDTGTCGNINILSKRRLDTGQIRVKDGDTLVLTGVLSDTNTTVETKWPILGDIPIFGNIFKSTKKGFKKNELIFLVTPRIINNNFSYTPDNFKSFKEIN